MAPASKQKLRAWFRPEDILLAGESEDRFFALCEDVLLTLGVEGEPSPTDYIAARSAVASLWAYDRESSNAEDILENVAQVQSYALARRNAYQEADDRLRLRGLALAGVRQAIELHRELRDLREGVSESSVQPKKVLSFGGRRG